MWKVLQNDPCGSKERGVDHGLQVVACLSAQLLEFSGDWPPCWPAKQHALLMQRYHHRSYISTWECSTQCKWNEMKYRQAKMWEAIANWICQPNITFTVNVPNCELICQTHTWKLLQCSSSGKDVWKSLSASNLRTCLRPLKNTTHTRPVILDKSLTSMTLSSAFRVTDFPKWSSITSANLRRFSQAFIKVLKVTGKFCDDINANPGYPGSASYDEIN